MTSIANKLWVGVVGSALLACSSGGDDDAQKNSLDREENVRVWATTASALAIYSNVYDPLAFADGEKTFDDPACPVTSDDGTTAVIAGGCIDSGGRRWAGSATVVRSDDGSRSLTLSDFTNFEDPEWVVSISGAVQLRRIDEGRHEFDANLVHSGGMTTTVDYSGSIAGGYGGPTTWNGSGTVTREGVLPPTGSITANTVDQVVDDARCGGQPVSGQTTIADDEHVAVVTYDGATDCDADQAARWSVDGEDRGLVTGIHCRVAGAGLGASGSMVPAAALLVFALGLGRRRSTSGGRSQVRRVVSRKHG
jgi:hypothetical protein